MSNEYLLHMALAVWSLIVGAFLCAVYDVFRLFRLRKKQNAIVLFICDLIFCLIATVSLLILFFNLSYGRMRMYALVLAVVGFLIWRLTVSRLVMHLMQKLIKQTEKILNSIKTRLASRIQRISRRIYTKHYCKRAVKEIETKGLLK